MHICSKFSIRSLATHSRGTLHKSLSKRYFKGVTVAIDVDLLDLDELFELLFEGLNLRLHLLQEDHEVLDLLLVLVYFLLRVNTLHRFH